MIKAKEQFQKELLEKITATRSKYVSPNQIMREQEAFCERYKDLEEAEYGSVMSLVISSYYSDPKMALRDRFPYVDGMDYATKHIVECPVIKSLETGEQIQLLWHFFSETPEGKEMEPVQLETAYLGIHRSVVLNQLFIKSEAEGKTTGSPKEKTR